MASFPPRAPARRHVVAVAIGNALEFYDLVTYAFFAAAIGRAFFPAHDPFASLLASLATFGAGFLTRPLGAVVLGRVADRQGRKPAMVTAFALIGVAVVGLALTPGYTRIGIAAPVLAVGFRLLQGFALGGELGPSTAWLMEAAPISRRGFYISLQCFGADCATLAAGLVGVGLSSLLSATVFETWGWRIAFLLGASVLPFGLMLRRALPETLLPATANACEIASGTDEVTSETHDSDSGGHRNEGVLIEIAPPRRVAALGLALLSVGALAAYVLNYLTTYAETTLAMPARAALGATVAVGLAGALVDPLAGWASDRFGRKRAMLLPWAALTIAVLPAFHWVAHARTPFALWAASALLAALQSMAVVSVLVSVTEALPARVRAGSLGLVYALAIAVFGGTTQFTIAWLTHATASALAPAWYLFAAGLIGCAAMLAMPETHPLRLGKRA